jgi:hypothetical protein
MGSRRYCRRFKDLFEEAVITGGAEHTPPRLDIRFALALHSATLPAGAAKPLDNMGNDTASPELPITVRSGDIGQINIRDSAAANDRLVVVSSAEVDWVTVTTTTTAASYIGFAGSDSGTKGSIVVSADRNVHKTTLTHQGLDFVEIRSLAANDRFAVLEMFVETRIYSGLGDDILNVGSNAGIGGKAQNTGGVLDLITAPLIVSGQGTDDYDILNLDDSADIDLNDGTLTASSLTNRIIEDVGPPVS